MSNRKRVIELLISHGAVLIPLQGKCPFIPEWQNATQSHPTALDPESTNNIGVVLGDASKGIVDVDIDRSSALPLARFFLPKTEMIFGRKSKPCSHWNYRCDEAGSCRKWQDEKGVIVELRANSGQTMFPSSVHPDSRECVEFEYSGAPAPISREELEEAVIDLAMATMLSPFYVAGCRHDMALGLAGFFRRAGWSEEKTSSFLEKLARANRDNEIEDRLRCAKDAYAFENPPGLETVCELLGETTAKLLARWLNPHGKDAPRKAGSRTVLLENDLDCAKLVAEKFEGKILYEPSGQRFYRRRQGVYDPVSDVEIQGLVQSHGETLTEKFHERDLKKFQSAVGVKNVMTMLRPMFLADARAFDSDPLLIGVQNGVFNLETKKLTQDASSIVTKRMKANYVPGADCPRFKMFLKEIMNRDDELYRYLRRILGYMLTGYTGEQVLFFGIGSGANGKSTLFSLLYDIFGDYAGYTPMSTLMQTHYGNENTYDLAALEGKRLVVAQEGEAGSRLAEAKIKAMTGSDPIACRPIYGAPKIYDPRFKLALVTNELPTINGIDEAIWRRIKLLPFRVSFPENQRDPHLLEKLIEERDGILNFLIGCYAEYEAACRNHGRGLAEPESVKRELREYRTNSDTVGTFLHDCCDVGVKGKTMTNDLHRAYAEWCEESSLDPVPKQTFARYLGKKGLESYRTAKGNGWKWIVLKKQDDDQMFKIGMNRYLV